MRAVDIATLVHVLASAVLHSINISFPLAETLQESMESELPA
jgi:hypothetical protein